jgi:RNA polymerase sigma factor (sigma-70 family)
MPPSAPEPRDPSRDHARFLEGLVSEQRAPLTRYAARLLGDADRARDVVQDVFVKLVSQPADSVDAYAVEWLFTVCRHRAFDILRKEGRMKAWEADEAERLPSAEPSPGRAFEAAETSAAILQLISRLPPKQQEAVRLKFQNGFSYKEIARITESSVSNVGFLIHAGLARLRSEWTAREAES